MAIKKTKNKKNKKQNNLFFLFAKRVACNIGKKLAITDPDVNAELEENKNIIRIINATQKDRRNE
jgi:hypothetical protein